MYKHENITLNESYVGRLRYIESIDTTEYIVINISKPIDRPVSKAQNNIRNKR